jgi:8-oxo-dGTP diphosphatase
MADLNERAEKVYLVRHALAGDRNRWRGDDRLRPLTKKGMRQAQALGALLEHEPIAQILSSPYRRCLETVAPLALRVGSPVEVAAALAEGTEPAAVLALVEAMPGGTVLCSHGDCILAVLEDLTKHGVLRPSEVQAEKGATWVLERVDRHVVRARYLGVAV